MQNKHLARRAGFVPGLVLAAVVLCTASAQAVPRWALSYQQDCHLCHVDPSGGGMRSLYASQFLVPGELAARWLDFEAIEALPSPQVNEQITVGADFRLLYKGGSHEPGEIQNFFQMQGDLYLHFQLDDRWSLFLDVGQGDSREAWASAHMLPFNGYLKAGRFVPAYGWRFEDHTAYVRDGLGLAPPANSDAGIELGFYPEHLALQFGASNGRRGLPFDSDDELALNARGELRGKLGPVALAAGGSVARLGGAGTRLDAGPFAGLSWGRFSWLGEVDWSIADRDTPTETTSLRHSHELAARLTRGVELIGFVDVADPDVDLASGRRLRYGGGVEALVDRHLELRGVVVVEDFEAGSAVAPRDRAQAWLLLHLLY